ncbi:MAG: UDP-N-acetylmuramoyl-L-alanyl-D-glutamate--2,6-diaminopimelate ligase [Ruminococcaceae bacterium]|nr:UDP-N-acetylmuramoyl-L-alanyl-D-glutamate--2,6-diaminopimelate ligase [Oscillospiraceae bacterium]
MKLKNLCEILTEEFAEKQLRDGANLTTMSCDGIFGDVTGVAFDSREVKDGYIFVAITGVVTDGHLYIPKAVENGALAVICENAEMYRQYKEQYKNVSFFLVKNARRALAIVSKHFYDCACEKLSIIGITGTKGKTSTSFMISKILNEAGMRCGIIGTTGAYFEDYFEEMSHSTPESRDLHALFAKMLSLGATHIVMEVSSQALMMYRVYGIEFEVGVFTNISPDHIGEGEHSDFDDYLYCKSKLFTMCKKAVINADSDKAQYVLDVCKEYDVPVTTYGCETENATYRAENESFYIDGGMKTHFDVISDDVKESVEVSVPGKFSVFNALCAASVALTLGVGFDHIKKALNNVKVIGRIEPVEHPGLKAPVIIDYAHNAMSMESLFSAVKAYNPKRIICVFGCGGNRSKLRRYEMGEISGKYADLSIITADNSRFEELDDIIADILIGIGKTDGKYEIVKDRRDAIYRAIDLSREGDIVLLAGKGQETYLDVKGVKTHFDEREVVSDYFIR